MRNSTGAAGGGAGAFARALTLFTVVLLSLSCSQDGGRRSRPVKLVLFIIVDQLRGDLPAAELDGGGFRHLLDQGVHFTNAHYKHATTVTAVGHATLMTGCWPAQHGVPGNEWFDRATDRRGNGVETI